MKCEVTFADGRRVAVLDLGDVKLVPVRECDVCERAECDHTPKETWTCDQR